MARQVSVSKFQAMMVDERAADDLAERMADRAEGAVSAMGRAHVVDVGPDGIIEAFRTAEMTPDRGPDVGETHHTITDPFDSQARSGQADQRFSGAGVDWPDADDLPFGEPSRLIPSDGAFLNERHKAAPELANLAEKLIDEHGFFEQLRHCRIDYKWRRKGTNSNGKRAIGKLERVSGIWSAYVPFTFVVWLAADTARLARFGDHQVEAALFHQLAHIAKDAKGNWIRIGHDFEGFGAEVRVYGPWTEDLKIGSQAFTVAVQLGLDMDAEDDDSDEEDLEDDEDVASGSAYYVDGQAVDDQRPYADEEPEELQEQRPRDPFMGEVGGPNDPDA